MDEITTIKCGNVNCYLVNNGEKSILIDTGTKRYLEKVERACKNTNLQAIILTHGHFDHVQNTANLVKKIGKEISVLMHEADYELIEDQMARPALTAHTLLGKMLMFFTKLSIKKETVPIFMPTQFIKEGDSLIDFGFSAKILDLKGHTKGSIGILLNDDILFVGDAQFNIIHESSALIYENREEMEKADKKIKSLNLSRIYYGHGKQTMLDS